MAPRAVRAFAERARGAHTSNVAPSLATSTGPPKASDASVRAQSASSSSEMCVSTSRLRARLARVLAGLARGQVAALAGALGARQRRLDQQQVARRARSR